MSRNELCALAAIDIRLGNGPNAKEAALETLQKLIEQSASEPGVIGVSLMKKDFKVGNKFEIVGRFDNEAAYLEHLASSANLAFRSDISALLGSPYEDRLHNAGGSQSWPSADVGEFMALTQFEVDPRALAISQVTLDALFEAQQPGSQHRQTVVLQRKERPYNFEILSVWESEEGFDAMVSSPEVRRQREALEPHLLAPIDDRRYRLLFGTSIGS